jgi:hypothetical protein
MSKTNWKELIAEGMSYHQETLEDVVSTTLSDDDKVKEFNSGYGGTEGVPFTLWTKKRVYFPVVYDGSEWVGSVSRDPDGVATNHIGGE